jgi:hypothetical protein
MIENRTILLPLLSVAGGVLLASLATGLTGAPLAISALSPAIVALVAASLLIRSAQRTNRALSDRVAVAESAVDAANKTAAQLRHDLRGILSPALLTADRLSNSQDPIARRAAEAMISTVERAEQRLRDV